MSILKYLKHRWYMFADIIVAGVFSYMVYWTDKSDALLYVLEGIGIFTVLFCIIDYFVLRSRIKKMAQFLNEHSDVVSSYPLDRIYAKQISRVIDEHKEYREHVETQHAREIEFITKWVHDVKVPISAIKLLTESVDDNVSEQLQMQTLYIEQNIQKILFRIKSRSLHEDFTIKQIDVKTIISRALKQYAVFFSYKKISLEYDCRDILVATDEKWSEYIISQIISNAVKYTPENEEIAIRTYEHDGRAVVSVRNTGVGIDEHSLKNIFKRGFSGGSLRAGAATGYGLYLSKKLADIMGHELSARSEPGEYAEFILKFNITNL